MSASVEKTNYWHLQTSHKRPDSRWRAPCMVCRARFADVLYRYNFTLKHIPIRATNCAYDSMCNIWIILKTTPIQPLERSTRHYPGVSTFGGPQCSGLGLAMSRIISDMPEFHNMAKKKKISYILNGNIFCGTSKILFTKICEMIIRSH